MQKQNNTDGGGGGGEGWGRVVVVHVRLLTVKPITELELSVSTI